MESSGQGISRYCDGNSAGRSRTCESQRSVAHKQSRPPSRDGAAARNDKPPVDQTLKVSVNAAGAGTAQPPFNTGEPYHLDIQLVVANVGTSPVFIVSAKLMDDLGRHSLNFTEVCNENEPLQPGARRRMTFPILYHSLFPRTPRHPMTPDALKHDNLFMFRLVRFICQPGPFSSSKLGEAPFSDMRPQRCAIQIS